MQRSRIILLAGVTCWTAALFAAQPVTRPARQTGTKPVLTAEPKVDQPPPVTAPAQPGATPDGPAHVSASYVLGPEDGIRVDVWREPNLSGSLTIRPDGRISLPLVGDMPAAGLTPMMLGDEIAKRLKHFVNEPLVTVTVNATNSKRVYLLGEIGRVGPLPITEDMTILQAISSAGGLSPYANKRHLYILRGPQGKQIKIPFDYIKATKTGDLQGVTLMPGDIVYVP